MYFKRPFGIIPLMKWTKSIFVMAYTTVNTLIFIVGLIRLLLAPSLAGLGIVIASGTVCAYMGSLYLRSPRTHPWIPELLGGTGLGFFLTLGGTDWQILTAGLPGLVASLLYIRWYSQLERGETVLKVGRRMINVSFRDVNGRSVSVRDLRGQAAVLLCYCGNWCPLCMAQIREVADRYRQIADLGAVVVLISPQPETQTAELSAKFDIPFRFWVDEKGKAIRQLGILHETGLPAGMQAMGYASDTVFPTLIVIDKEGIIRFLDQTDNYRIRPHPDTFISILKKL